MTVHKAQPNLPAEVGTAELNSQQEGEGSKRAGQASPEWRSGQLLCDCDEGVTNVGSCTVIRVRLRTRSEAGMACCWCTNSPSPPFPSVKPPSPPPSCPSKGRATQPWKITRLRSPGRRSRLVVTPQSLLHDHHVRTSSLTYTGPGHASLHHQQPSKQACGLLLQPGCPFLQQAAGR